MTTYKEIEKAFYELKKEHAKTFKFVNVILNNLPDYTNLKLYDIAYQMESDSDWKLFDDFCIEQYDVFKHYQLEYENLETVHIGRTSSFHIVPNDTQFWDYHTNDLSDCDISTPHDLLYISGYNVEFYELDSFECCDTFGEWLDVVNESYYTSDMNDLDELELTIESVRDEIELAREHIKELIQELRHVRKQGYKFIQDFKNNQIEIFKEWKENNDF